MDLNIFMKLIKNTSSLFGMLENKGIYLNPNIMTVSIFFLNNQSYQIR